MSARGAASATAGPSEERCCGRRQARPRNAVAGDGRPVRGTLLRHHTRLREIRCSLCEGLLESPAMPLDESIAILRTMDTVQFGGDPELIGGRRRVSGAMVNEAVGNAWGATGGDHAHRPT